MADNYRMKLAKRTERQLVYRLVYHLFHFKLTATGRALFWVFLVSSAVSLFSFLLKAYIVWCGILSLCAVSIFSSRLARRPLLIEVEVPERVRCGQEFRIEIQAAATKRAARDVRVYTVLPSALESMNEVGFVGCLKAGDKVEFVQRVMPKKRGAYLLDHLLQENCYPFGLWRDSRRESFERTVLVYPRYEPLRELEIPVGRTYQPGGLALTSYLGDSTEFLSIREFRSGDPIRHIHWRSWARLGKPIVKEYGEEYFCRLALIVDTVLADPEKPEQLESAISLAASITDYLSRQEYVIDLFAAGPKLYYLQAGRSLAYLQNIMDVLACLEPTPANDESFLEMEVALLEEVEGISTTLLIFTDWDERRQRLLDELSSRGTAVRGFFVSDDETKALKLPENVRWLSYEMIEGGLDEI